MTTVIARLRKSTSVTSDPTPRLGVRWGRLVLGVLLVLVGAVLTVTPFASLALLVLLVIVGLALTGAGELATYRRADSPTLALVAGLG